MLKILIADDHQLVIDGLKLMLAEAEDVHCVAEANNGVEVLRCLETTSADVILLDINMPEMDGLTCCKLVREQYPNVKILVLSMLSDANFVKSMLKNGANGYLLKNAGKDEVLEAIRLVNEGKQAYSPEVLEGLLNSFSEKKTKPANGQFLQLSRREKQVLQLIVDEKTTGEIAEELFISFATVESHRRNILSKLNVRNTAGLVKAAIEFDLLD